MNNEEIKKLLLDVLDVQDIYVASNDGSHFQIIAVAEQFEQMSRIKKQQIIYAPLMPYISDNRIHAVSIKTYTPIQWQRERKLLGL